MSRAHLVTFADPKSKKPTEKTKRRYRVECPDCPWRSAPMSRVAAERQRDAHVCDRDVTPVPEPPIEVKIERSKRSLREILNVKPVRPGGDTPDVG